MLFGHTHKPYHRIVCGESGEKVRHAVNTGSVGKPKDGDPRACWVLVEVEDEPRSGSAKAIDVEFVRVEYDLERAAREIEGSPLPDLFAAMLRTGKGSPG